MKIFICGDSTAASYSEELAPLTGWGQVLSDFLPGIEVINHAFAGRSSKSFLYEGRLLPVEESLSPDDLLLIQFAHNDESIYRWRRTEPWIGYRNALNLYIQTARLHEAQPVLLTPICIRDYRDGVLCPSHEGYLDAMKSLASMTGTPLIDLYQLSFDLVSKLGEAASSELYMNLAPGTWPGHPDGKTDNVHTTRTGACHYARLVAEEMQKMGLAEVNGSCR